MKFRYKKLGRGLIRPVMPITVSNGDESVRYEVLVDSGADMNLMNAEIAEIIGINIKSGRKGSVRGVTGQPEAYYTHKVSITVGGHTCEVDVSFAERVGNEGYGILGQKGFFDLFKVKFDYSKEEIEVITNR